MSRYIEGQSEKAGGVSGTGDMVNLFEGASNLLIKAIG